ncbi:hypothetical protein ADL07_18770 [Streptomyces sp. NRRL F-4707]|nr:hypothetical protein ADL07_18770 [Streptomyces sp. NRRL F-4707]
MRFEESPRTRVSFPGTGARTSVSRTERTRLPRRVEPGRDYRDVTVRYRLASRLTGTSRDGPPPDEDGR